jgi:hypothetical protein
MLTFHTSMDQGPGQPQTGGLVGKRTVLPDAPLNLSSRWHQARRVMPARAQPVDANTMFHTEPNPLGGQLREAVQQHRVDSTDRMFGFWLIARPNDKPVSGTPHVRSLGNDVKSGPIAVGWKQPDRIALGLTILAHLLR